MLESHNHHHHQPLQLEARKRRRVIWFLSALVVPLVAATALGLWWLWPGKVSAMGSQALLAPGMQQVLLEVTDVEGKTCGAANADLSLACGKNLTSGAISAVHIPPEVLAETKVGQRIWAVTNAPGSSPSPVGDNSANAPLPAEFTVYLDSDRGVPLLALALIYLVVVLAVAWHRGLLALAGLVVSVAVIVTFVVPAIMNGENPLAVTLVGVSAMILASVYLAHGISIKTTTALLGTYFGLVLTSVLAVISTRALHLLGSAEEYRNLYAQFPQLSLSAVLTCGIIIAGLGALNDVTITQAATVWELYSSNPTQSRWQVFTSAMRVGRDHIASTVYTLAFAYAGTALPTLMLVMLVDRPAGSILGAGEVAEEITRTLVASIGLVLAIPVTTGIGALLLPAQNNESTAPLPQTTDSDRREADV